MARDAGENHLRSAAETGKIVVTNSSHGDQQIGRNCLVVEVEGQIVGFLSLAFPDGLSGVHALIDELAVEPAYRRQGIGAYPTDKKHISYIIDHVNAHTAHNRYSQGPESFGGIFQELVFA